MSKTKIVLAMTAVLAGAGAIAAVSAPGPRGHGDRHGGYGHHGMGEVGEGGLDRRGWLRGNLTKEDFETHVRERFAALDKNSDGFIDASEIEAMHRQLGGRFERMRGRRGAEQSGGAGGLGPMFQRLDADKDGKVTRDELQAATRKAFAEADLDRDGKISDADLPPMMRDQGMIARLAAAHGAMGMHPRGMRGHGRDRGPMHADGMGPGQGAGMGGGIGRLIQGADVKDGAVTLDAVLAATTRRFDRMDRNKDGVFDTADRDALRKEMTDYHVKRFLHAHGAGADGKVSREQFAAKAAERFAAMDVDGDGRIGRSEGGGWRGKHHGGMHHDRMHHDRMHHDGMNRDGAPHGGRGPHGGAPDGSPKQQ